MTLLFTSGDFFGAELVAFREQLQVLVVDENSLTRFGIFSIANLHLLLRVCGEAADARAARAAHAEALPDIVILDILLPHGDGLELLREFASFEPKCRALVVSELTDSATFRRAFQAGAQAFVSKKDDAAQLLCALEAVVGENTYVSKRVTALLQTDFARKVQVPLDTLIDALSDRELNIFRRIARAQGNAAIARELSVSVKTVETHVARIQEKLHLRSSTDLHRGAETWWAALHGE